MKAQRYSFILSLTSALGGDGWSKSGPGRFNPGKDPVPTEYEAGWAARPVWMGADYLSPHRDSILGPSSP